MGLSGKHHLDESKCTFINSAKAGRSTRTFLNEGRWEQVYNSLQPGDFVLLQFGHNDIGPIDKDRMRGTIPGTSDSTHVYRMATTGNYELVYTFGWYLKKFIQDVREKGATPILLSLTPRNKWKDGKIERRNDTYGKWYREVAAETGVDFVDVHNISADFLDKKCGSKEKADPYYKKDHTHTSLLGAKNNAQSVKKGLKKTKSGLVYKIENPGEGNLFKASDVVKVVYTGKHISGEVFDSSNGNAVDFPLQGVVPGFREMITMMRPGAKAYCIIPGHLAYGPQGNPKIAPNETLIFELETQGLAE